ncbi:MAG: hypothetical protein PVI21_02915 [Candidatus Woesebacteria bacterium]|jgi:hypothetical protein
MCNATAIAKLSEAVALFYDETEIGNFKPSRLDEIGAILNAFDSTTATEDQLRELRKALYKAALACLKFAEAMDRRNDDDRRQNAELAEDIPLFGCNPGDPSAQSEPTKRICQRAISGRPEITLLARIANMLGTDPQQLQAHFTDMT